MISGRVFSYQKKILLLIAIATVAKFIIASTLELGVAEAYYWTYALHLEWNFFDHPPIVAWLIRLTTTVCSTGIIVAVTGIAPCVATVKKKSG